MPFYIYSCEKCGREFEVIQEITDKKFTNHLEVTQGHYDLAEPCNGKIVRHLGTIGYRRDHTIKGTD
jgi:predicted nucleic acid-binding Zn ribbon protein